MLCGGYETHWAEKVALVQVLARYIYPKWKDFSEKW